MPTPAKAMPALKNAGTAAAMVAAATSQVGYREGTNNDTVYGAWYGMNHEAWCAIFVSWAAAQSGCEAVVPKHAYTPAGADWFRSRDQWGHAPRVGAIVYYFNASLGRIAHVGVVVKVNADGSWISCEGNTNDNGSRTGNGVYLLRRTSTRGGGFGYPKYKPAPPKPAAEKRPVVNLAKVVSAAKKDPKAKPGTFTAKADVAPVEAALVAKGLLDKQYADGHFGTKTREAYAAWQRSLGFRGDDADGLPGLQSLRRLGAHSGFDVKE